MSKISALVNNDTGIPQPVKNFLLRSIIIFITWKLIYLLILLPLRLPDSQLTNITAKVTSMFFNAIHHSTSTFHEDTVDNMHRTVFFINGKRAIGIADSCNALELMVLYVGFLFTMPTTFKRRLSYSVFGLLGIFILNVLRCYALAILNLNHSSIAEFAHHYLFTMIIYGLIFIVWIKYSKPNFHNEY